MVPGLCAEQAGATLLLLHGPAEQGLTLVPSACRCSFTSEVKGNTSVRE